MNVKEVLSELKKQSDPSNLPGMLIYSISIKKALGTRVPVLKQMVEKLDIETAP